MDDVFTLQLTAETLYNSTLLSFIIIFGYGIYLPLFLKSTLLVSPRIRFNIPSRWLLALMIALFVPTTVHLISGTFETLTLLQFANVGRYDDPLELKFRIVWDLTVAADNAFFYSGRINILLIDVIVVWRAYALQPHRKYLRALLVTVLIIALLFSASMIVITSNDHLFYSVPVSQLNRLYIARDVLALSVTIFGTACIGWSAWAFRRTTKEPQFRNHTTLFVARTFRVLVEGCVILTVLQIAVLGLGLRSDDDRPMAKSPTGILYALLSEITILASAIHPCLVTVLVSEAQAHMQSTTGVSDEAKLISSDITEP
ncbi:hypothetical protein DL96DRAFT_843805 [Flagelloscypha sp. PMI_526]|nr:hypothetical protein DL96DRAFT_843805 [Flagelloscypha sp. PMI_526]